MKKIFLGCGATILSFGLLFTVLFLIYKSFTISDLKKKCDNVDKIWHSFVKKENLKNKKTVNLLEFYNFKNSDSLKIYLKKNFNYSSQCNENFVYDEYLLNKYFLMTFDPYLKNKDLLLENKKKFESILKDIAEQNIIIADYDSNVRDYNTFIGIFPNFIIAKSNGFKMKKYFQIKFGEKNKDPKLVRQETLEWMKKIEKQQGLSE